MIKKISYTLPVFLLLLIGCGGDQVDVTPPTMEAVDYLPMPVADDICGTQDPNVFHLTGGDELTFNVIFKDDEALSQYKVDIHNNFDCHGHGGGSAPSVANPTVNSQTTDWTALDIQNLSGTSAPVVHTLNVPQDVTAGNYHFHIQVIDEAGNDSPFTNYFSLKIKNPLDDIVPQIHVQEPTTASFSIGKGETVRFAGNVTDNKSLSEGGNGILYLSYTDLSSGNTFATDIAIPFEAGVTTHFDFDFEYTIPQTLVAGDYRFSLGANDGVRNVAPFVFFEVAVEN